MTIELSSVDPLHQEVSSTELLGESSLQDFYDARVLNADEQVAFRLGGMFARCESVSIRWVMARVEHLEGDGPLPLQVEGAKYDSGGTFSHWMFDHEAIIDRALDFFGKLHDLEPYSEVQAEGTACYGSRTLDGRRVQGAHFRYLNGTRYLNGALHLSCARSI